MKIGAEAAQTYVDKMNNGFFSKYCFGKGLDIGYRGYMQDVHPVLPNANGIDLDYPGYDGRTLPLRDKSYDFIYNSHCLEHIEDYKNAIQDWYRVLKVGGFMIIVVPHQYLYEKRRCLPSKWNEDHKRFYTPCTLLLEVEQSLQPNSYRVRFLEDGDKGFDYSLGPTQHSGGQYEITLVIEKINPPNWSLE